MGFEISERFTVDSFATLARYALYIIAEIRRLFLEDQPSIPLAQALVGRYSELT